MTSDHGGLAAASRRNAPEQDQTKLSGIESRLGVSAVTAFNGPAPIMYAKATGSIIFGEFVGGSDDDDATRKPAVIFTSCDYHDDDRDSVAICLFGSMDNFEGAIQEAGPVQVRGGGWHSSSAPYVFNFLKTYGKASNRGLEQLAWDALQIAGEQGFNAYKDAPFGFDRPWLRAFTYGDLQDAAEWLAEIYLDIDFLNTKDLVPGRKWGFRRVLVGAPFWIRTPKPQAMRLYAKHRPELFTHE